jgi:hypothetical protein
MRKRYGQLNKKKMKKFVILILCFTIGCSPRIVDFSSICKDVSNSYLCAQKIEKFQLTQFKKSVERKDKTLVLKIDSGTDLVLEDRENGDNVERFSFRDYVKDINSYIIEIQYFEGGAYCLINKSSGKKITIPGLIKISPDKTRIVSYNEDLISRYTTNGFVIYRLINNSFLKEYELEIDDWGPSKADWTDNSHIEFAKSTVKDENVKVIGKIIYEYSGKWIEKK